MKLIKKFKQLLAEHKEKRDQNELLEVRGMFAVEERGGLLWLTCDGCAFKELPQNMTSAEIVFALNSARTSAVKHHAL